MDQNQAIDLYYRVLALADGVPLADPHYLIEGDEEGWEHYCYGCAIAELQRIRLGDASDCVGEDDRRVVGESGSESDSVESCESCGIRLRFGLTDYAVSDELDHFETYGFDAECKRNAYDIANIVLGGMYSKPEVRAAAIGLGERFLASALFAAAEIDRWIDDGGSA